MLRASIVVHASFGALLALFFVFYYINFDSKWKLHLELLIGVGGNSGVIWIFDTLFALEDDTIRMYSIASCICMFLLTTLVLLISFSFLIKDKDDRDIIRLRDILLGQTAWINKYYEKRGKEIDNKLNIAALEAREVEVTSQERYIKEEKAYISEELERLESAKKKALKLKLPEKKEITLNRNFLEAMPSYNDQMLKCLSDISSCTNSLLAKSPKEIDITAIKSYLISVATYISNDIFGAPNGDARIHFRIYDPEKNGYVKFVAVIGNKVINQDMTVIPYSDDNMINQSFSCKRALIKSINYTHDYQSNNHSVWQDYMTYTFYGLEYENKPFLSFGISIKNTARYKNHLYFLNFFRLEYFLQENIEQVNEHVAISRILYGGIG